MKDDDETAAILEMFARHVANEEMHGGFDVAWLKEMYEKYPKIYRRAFGGDAARAVYLRAKEIVASGGTLH